MSNEFRQLPLKHDRLQINQKHIYAASAQISRSEEATGGFALMDSLA
ncbi:hypothetical protein ABH973_000056 [Bradyrhizobium ottawaense]